MNWILVSVVLSIVLTIGLNIAVRAFPSAPERMMGRADSWAASERADDGPRVRVFFPWKAMLVGSIVLTVLVNVIAALTR